MPQKLEPLFGNGTPKIEGKYKLLFFLVWPDGTVDGRNPAPPEMQKNPVNNGINYLSTGAGFLPSTVCLGNASYTGASGIRN